MQLTLFLQRMLKKRHVMHSRSNNIKCTSNNDANEVVDVRFEPLRSRYQGNLETSMRGSDFIFGAVQVMYYQWHRVNFKRGGSYINFPDYIKKEKVTIN